MSRNVALFLRGISNVPMQPFRERLAALGLQDVASYGMSGNFVFTSSNMEGCSLEHRLADAFGVAAFVRTRRELDEIVAADPYLGETGASIFIAHRALEREQTSGSRGRGVRGQAPRRAGSVVYFAHPTRAKARKTIFDFERKLGVEGTMRASRVVQRVLAMMEAE